MRTFWLEDKDNRIPLDRNIESPAISNKSTSGNQDIICFSPARRSDDRRAGSYTPITFKDVARRSIANSPMKYSSVKESRSNSIGAFYVSSTNHTDFFGSGVFDQSPQKSCDISSSSITVPSPCPFRSRCTTAPPRTEHKSEVSLTAQGKPSDLPPGHILCTENAGIESLGLMCLSGEMSKPCVSLAIAPSQGKCCEADLIKPGLGTTQLMTASQLLCTTRDNFVNCQEEAASPTKTQHSELKEPKYEFGKSMHEYAKKLGKSKSDKKVHVRDSEASVCTQAQTSQGQHHTRKPPGHHHHYPNSHVHHHNPHHQQCCSGFGAGNRHRFQSNACVIF